MASAVYQTKLTADTTQHDQALGKSAKQVYNYKKSCDEADKGVSKMFGGIKKLTGAFAAAKIAGETFKGMLKNNTETADNYQRAMNAVNTVTNEFQYALSTFDFSNMFNGLGDMVARANEYYNALDDLQTLQTSLIGENARLNSQMAEARRRYLAGDKGAAEEIRQIGDQMAGNVKAEQDALRKEMDAYVKSMTSVSVKIKGSQQIINRTAGDFRSADEIQNLLHNQQALGKAISDARIKWQSYVRQLEADNDKIFSHWDTAARYEAEYRALKKLQDRMGDDDGLKHFEENYAKYYQLSESYAQTMAKTERMLRRDDKKSTSSGAKWHATVKVEPEIPEGSIAALEKQISDLKTQYNLATTSDDRNELLEKIKAVEAELNKMKLDPSDILPEGSMAQLEARLKELKLQWSLATTDENRADIQAQIDQIQEEIDHINGVTIEVKVQTPRENINEMINKLRREMELADTPELQIKIGFQIDDLAKQLEQLDESLKTPQERINDKIEQMKQGFEELGNWCSDACDVMSQALNAFANSNDEAANKTLKTAASIISSIGSAIPKLLALVSAEQADAIAGAVASGSKLPFPANLAAIATAVAQVMSALAPIVTLMAQARSYATGGIIKGGSYVGDNNIARVNAGEMILNGTQQARLFRILNGSVGPQQPGSNGGKVEFHISGTELVGVLSNNDKQRRRVS